MTVPLWSRLADGIADAVADANTIRLPPAAVLTGWLAGPPGRLGHADLTAVLLAPHHVHESLPAVTTLDRWLAMVRLAEAAWAAVESPDDHGVLSRADADRLRPAAARLRFLVLSEPLRDPAWPADPDIPSVRAGLAGIFGVPGYRDLTDRARTARSDWLHHLHEYQSHPLLVDTTAAAFEAELDLLLFTDRSRRRRLVISPRAYQSPGPAPATPDDNLTVCDVTEQHLLPRMMLTAVANAANRTSATRTAGWVTAAALCAAVLAVAVTHHYAAAAWTAVGGYALLGAAAVHAGRIWAYQWLLRLPAAGAVGLFVLLTLNPAWILQPSPGLTWPAAAVLAAAGTGYLTIEARNHGATSAAAVRRALAVTGIGLVHAVLISLIGLVLIAPAYVEHGADVQHLWTHPDSGSPWTVLTLATAWSFTAGIFSQILWDDRPITAPLAHLRWQRGR